MSSNSPTRLRNDWGYGFGSDPSRPTLPEPPARDVEAAMPEVARIFASDQFVRMRVERDGGEPLHFLLTTIMDRLHRAQPTAQWADFEPAAQWAIRRHIVLGRLVETAGQVAPTEALWGWWRNQADGVNSAAAPVGNDFASDLIGFDEIRKLIGVSKKTLQNAVAEWRAAGYIINDPASYATIRPLLRAKWKAKAAIFPEALADARTILDARK